VAVEFDFPTSKPSIIVKIPLDPLQRKKLLPEQMTKIVEEIKKISPNDLDSLSADIKVILDKYIPTNPPNSTLRQTVFRTTLSKEVVAEIKRKKRLYKNSALHKQVK